MTKQFLTDAEIEAIRLDLGELLQDVDPYGEHELEVHRAINKIATYIDHKIKEDY